VARSEALGDLKLAAGVFGVVSAAGSQLMRGEVPAGGARNLDFTYVDVTLLVSSATNWIPNRLRNEVTQAAVKRGISWREKDRSHGAMAAGFAMDTVGPGSIQSGPNPTLVSGRVWRRERKQHLHVDH
jgi:hypothetical protein